MNKHRHTHSLPIVAYTALSLCALLLYRNESVYSFMPALTGFLPMWPMGLLCGAFLAVLSRKDDMSKAVCFAPSLAVLCALRVFYEVYLKSRLLSATASEAWIVNLYRLYPMRPDGSLSLFFMGFLAGALMVHIINRVIVKHPAQNAEKWPYICGLALLISAIAIAFCDGYIIERPDRSLIHPPGFMSFATGIIIPLAIGLFMGFTAAFTKQWHGGIWPLAISAAIVIWFIVASVLPETWMDNPISRGIFFIPSLVRARSGTPETVLVSAVALGACGALGSTTERLRRPLF